jgi:DNA-binding transcriptional MerR regulator
VLVFFGKVSFYDPSKSLLLKLYRLSKDKGMSVKQVVDLLAIANNDLPAIEERFKTLRNDIGMLQFQRRIDERNLYQLNTQIASTTKLLNSFRISCIRERREIENLCNEKARLETTITEFKSNNEEYLKIKETAFEEVKRILTDSKLLLQLATASVIESLRSNPELCNFVIHDNSNNTSVNYGSNYLSLMSGEQQQQSFNDSFACPYDKKITNNIMSEGNTKNPDVDYLFYLSEIALAVKLALAKATEEESTFKIRSPEDVYHVLIDKETLEKVLQQGLKEEHKQYKDKILEFFINMKDRIKIEDLRFY